MTPERWLGAVVAAVVVLAVVAAAISSGPEESFDPDTPAGTVQAYARAVLEADSETASAFLANDSPCEASDFDVAFVSDVSRIVLQDEEVDGSEARVEVEVVHRGAGGPFDPGEWSTTEQFDLVEEGDGWAIMGAPWPVHFCPDRR